MLNRLLASWWPAAFGWRHRDAPNGCGGIVNMPDVPNSGYPNHIPRKLPPNPCPLCGKRW